MIAHKKEFSGGLVMFLAFWVIYAMIMSPIFGGKNILDFMDNLYNTISKNSSYLIPELQKKTGEFNGTQISFGVKAKGDQAARVVKFFEAAGATAVLEGEKVKVKGDLGAIIANTLTDADAMFKNDGKSVAAKYGLEEQLAQQLLYDSYNAIKAAVKDLNTQSKFKESAILSKVMSKGIEPAFNYYSIPSVPISQKWGTVVLSLAGYVIYTLWFGFAILFMFEGWGLKLEH